MGIFIARIENKTTVSVRETGEIWWAEPPNSRLSAGVEKGQHVDEEDLAEGGSPDEVRP